MNQNYNTGNNPIYTEGTYPPYMNNPNYANNNQSNHVNPQYAENIFSMNVGKTVSVYFSYPDSVEWRDKVFTGTILTSGRDYLILSDRNGKKILLWLVYINYATFDQEISY